MERKYYFRFDFDKNKPGFFQNVDSLLGVHGKKLPVLKEIEKLSLPVGSPVSFYSKEIPEALEFIIKGYKLESYIDRSEKVYIDLEITNEFYINPNLKEFVLWLYRNWF